MTKTRGFPSNTLSKMTRQMRGMKSLIQVVQTLSLARDEKTIHEIVVAAARRLTGADGATFVLRDGNFCHYVNEEAISPLWKGKRFPLETCISGWVMLNRKSVVIKNIYEDPRIPIDAYRPTFVKSLAMVPIRKSSPLGAIGNYWSSFHQPTKEDLQLLQALADTTAVALENIQLYNELEERVQQRTEELQTANKAIHHLSLHDELTGLYNRRGFYLLAEQELKRARRQDSLPTIMFIDIDGLKEVNDELGHKIGDRLIISAARSIKSAIRESDIIGRIGGDEFCIFALDCHHGLIRNRLQEIIDKFNKQSHSFELSMSIGCTTPHSNTEKLEALLSRADQEMYNEKRFKKQQVRSSS